MNSYEEGKKYLAQIWIDITKITKQIGDYLFAMLDDRNISTDEIKCFAAPQTPPEDVLGVLWLNKEYFIWKKVLDLWWWLGWMPFLLEEYVDQYVVCDPCFVDVIRANTFDRALSTQEFVISFNQKPSPFLEKKQKVLDYINVWKRFNQEDHPKIIINSSKWEDINWIENWSQDIVFICHVLDKGYVNYLWIMAEVSRILKSDWDILIVEDADDEMRKVLLRLWLTWQEKDFKIICRIKKTP